MAANFLPGKCVDVWNCPLCKAIYSTLFHLVSRVLKAHHSSLMKRGINLPCPVTDCSKKQFVNASTYYKHIRKKHFDLYFGTENDKENDSDTYQACNLSSCVDTDDTPETQTEDHALAPTEDQSVHHKAVAASSLLKLKLDHRLFQWTIDDIVEMN